MAAGALVPLDPPSLIAPQQATAAPDADLKAAADGIGGAYPALSPYVAQLAVTRGQPSGPDDDRQLEFYQPWDEDNPAPGKLSAQVFSRDLKGDDLRDSIALDMLHHLGTTRPDGAPVDPKWYALKQQLADHIKQADRPMDREAYASDAKQYPGTGSYDDWLQHSRVDAYVRALVNPRLNPEWQKPGVLTPDMQAVGGKFRAYLATPPASEAHMDPTLEDLLARAQPADAAPIDVSAFAPDHIDYGGPDLQTPQPVDPVTVTDGPAPSPVRGLVPQTPYADAASPMLPSFNPGPMDTKGPDPVKKPSLFNSEYGPTQRWLMAMSALHDAGKDFAGEESGDQFGASMKAAKAENDAADTARRAEVTLRARQVAFEGDPRWNSYTPAQRQFLLNAPADDFNKAAAETFKPATVPGGDYHYNPLGQSFTPPKYGESGGVIYSNGPTGVTAQQLPLGAKDAGELAARAAELAQPHYEYAGTTAGGQPAMLNTKTGGWGQGNFQIGAKPDNRASDFDHKFNTLSQYFPPEEAAGIAAGIKPLTPAQIEMRAQQAATQQVGQGGDPAAWKVAHDDALARLTEANSQGIGGYGRPPAPGPYAPPSTPHAPPTGQGAPSRAPTPVQTVAQIPPAQVALLKAHPDKWRDFDAKYGQGMAGAVLRPDGVNSQGYRVR